MKTVFKFLLFILLLAILYFLKGILISAFTAHPIAFILVIVITVFYVVYYGKYAGFF